MSAKLNYFIRLKLDHIPNMGYIHISITEYRKILMNAQALEMWAKQRGEPELGEFLASIKLKQARKGKSSSKAMVKKDRLKAVLIS